MSKKQLIYRILTIFVVLGVLITGCKKEEASSADNGYLMDIKKRGKLVVGTEAAFAPFEYVEEGKIIGYGPDILAEINKNLNVEIDQQDVPFSGLLPGLEEKKFDFIASAIIVSPERREKYAMTTPIADGSSGILKLKDVGDINTIEDLDGKIVGVGTGMVSEKTLNEYSEKLKSEGKKGIDIRNYTSLPEAHLDLKNKRIDAVVQSIPTINVLVKKEPDVFAAGGRVGSLTFISWAVRKDDEDLLKFLNEEILKLKKSGKLEELQQKWFGTTWDLPDELI